MYQLYSGKHADQHVTFDMDNQYAKPQSNGTDLLKLVRQPQIVQSVMYSYDAVISSYIIPAIYPWFCKSARDFDDET